MTRQEIFDKVAAHLIKQGCKSMNTEHRCLYRGQDGARCAVGIFIPDDAYKPEMEGLTAAQMSSTFPDALPAALRQDIMFLSELQRAHDSSICRTGWPFINDVSIRLRTVARTFGLDYSIVTRRVSEREASTYGTPSSDDATVHSIA